MTPLPCRPFAVGVIVDEVMIEVMAEVGNQINV